MRPAAKRAATAVLVLLLGAGLCGAEARRIPIRTRRVRITWMGDLARAFKLARSKGVPVLLFLRDTFGVGYIEHVERRFNWGEASPSGQMRRSGARWRWQRYEADLFARPEVAEVVKPFVRVRLDLPYGGLERNLRTLLLQLNLLNDVELAWRRRLIDEPYRESPAYVDPLGRLRYDRVLNATPDELLARELTCVAVVAGDGQLLLRFPAGPPGFEPPLEAWLAELTQVLKPYRALFDARRELQAGRVASAAEVLRQLAKTEEAPGEVRRSAQAELEQLRRQAVAGLQEAKKALDRNNFVRAWEVLSEVRRRGLDQADPDLASQVDSLAQRVEAHARCTYQEAQEHLQAGRLFEGCNLLTQVARRFKGTEAASLAQSRLDEVNRDPTLAEKLRQARRKQEAERLWTSALSAEKAEDILTAYRNYKTLAQNYPDLPPGAQAQEKLSAWEADPDLMTRIHSLEADEQARKWMNLARNYFLNQVYSEAIQYYQKVIDTHPESSLAAEARTRLQEARRLLEAQLKPPPQEPAPEEEGPTPQEKPSEEEGQ